MEANIKLSCANCGTEFEKVAREYRRQVKKGHTRFFCTSSCAAIKINSEIERSGNPQFLVADNRRDEYTPFRWYVLRGQYRGKRKRKYGCDLTVEYLKQLWEEQKGICPITGWHLVLAKSTNKPWETSCPNNASIDRIDNSKGYMQGNVRFIAFMANLARQSFTDERLIDFCKAVYRNQ